LFYQFSGTGAPETNSLLPGGRSGIIGVRYLWALPRPVPSRVDGGHGGKGLVKMLTNDRCCSGFKKNKTGMSAVIAGRNKRVGLYGLCGVR
jgi:hypothetical protein